MFLMHWWIRCYRSNHGYLYLKFISFKTGVIDISQKQIPVVKIAKQNMVYTGYNFMTLRLTSLTEMLKDKDQTGYQFIFYHYIYLVKNYLGRNAHI